MIEFTTIKDLYISDKRMLELMDYAIRNRIKGITSQADFCKMLGSPKTIITDVYKRKNRSFTVKQLDTAGAFFDVDMNWFFGRSNTMHLKHNSRSATDLIKEGLMLIEQKEVKSSTRVKKGLESTISKKVSI